MKSAAPIANSIARMFDQMIANAPEEQSELAGDNHSFRIVCREKSDSLFTSEISESSQNSESSQFSNVLNTEICYSVPSVICTSIPSIRKTITWGSIAQSEMETKKALEGLEEQVRSWYRIWIEPVYTPDIENLETQVADMAEFLLDALDEPNVMSLLEAYYQVNRIRLNGITQQAFTDIARRTIAFKQREWLNSLPADEAEYHKQLTEPYLRSAHRILRALAQKALKEGGSAEFHMSENELNKRVTSLGHREAGRLLRKLPYIALVEIGEKWKPGRKPKASRWRWLVEL